MPEISLALLHEQAGSRDEAEELFNEAVKAAPSDLNTRLAVVHWALIAGRNKLASQNIAAAQKLDADLTCPQGWYHSSC